MLDCTNTNYDYLMGRAEEIEDELEDLRHQKYAIEDDDEAEELFGEEIAELEAELNGLYSEMDEIDDHLIMRDYYASVL